MIHCRELSHSRTKTIGGSTRVVWGRSRKNYFSKTHKRKCEFSVHHTPINTAYLPYIINHAAHLRKLIERPTHPCSVPSWFHWIHGRWCRCFARRSSCRRASSTHYRRLGLRETPLIRHHSQVIRSPSDRILRRGPNKTRGTLDGAPAN